MDSTVGIPRFCGLKIVLVAGLALLTTDALFAQSADQSDMNALKAQMNQMQKQYEQRIEAMEAKMKSLESNQGSGSILNTRVLTDANGVAAAPTPLLDESFLKSLTRNFTFNMYVRAGFMFNGNGGAGTFNFEAPDNPGGRWRLGNENDFYMEPSFSQAHILGDSPDVADVSFRFTPNFFTNGVFHESFLTTGSTGFNGTSSDFRVGMREAYTEFKNVFKGAPEITFWGGQRFYDRWNYDPNDWFWLDTSGFGIGAYNIQIGPGNLWLAWIGANKDTLNLVNNANQLNSIGDQFEQTFDARYHIDFLCGKLVLVGIGNYMKGGVVTPNGGQTFTNVLGATDTVNVQTSDAYGGGGGIIWEYDYGNKSYFRINGLFGWGLTNFSAEYGLGGNSITAFEQGVNGFVTGKSEPNVHFISPAVAASSRANLTTGVVTNTPASNAVYSGSINPWRGTHTFRAGFEWVWNVTECFSYDLWAYWDENNQGFTEVGTNGAGQIFTAAKTRDFFGVGFRPVYWLTDNFAIQGQAGYGYVNNVRGYSGVGNVFGNHGSWGILTIAPTIKPKGGYFTRPEIRVFATWSRWSDSLRGSTTPVGEGGNTGPSSPPYNSLKTNQGWLIGTQAEISF
jgi:maltoporin